MLSALEQEKGWCWQVSEGELAALVVTAIIAVSGLISAISAAWNAAAAREIAEMARREFEVSRLPELKLSKLAVKHRNGRLTVTGEIGDTKGHHAILLSVQTGIEVWDPEGDEGQPCVLAREGQSRKPKRRIYGNSTYPIRIGTRLNDSVINAEVAIWVRYTFSGAYALWRREVWVASATATLVGHEPEVGKIEHMFSHTRREEYGRSSGVWKLGKWLEKGCGSSS